MIDNRIYTFLDLCATMNYRQTAENLLMTQPAVTQHIKYLEGLYKCKLFSYRNRKLSKTDQCLELEKTARAIISLNMQTANTLAKDRKIKLSIGATKTIGEYAIDELVLGLTASDKYDFNLIIDNTERLLEELNHFRLDFLMIEGYFDKNSYGFKPISKEEIVGICSKDHPFAGKEVELEEIFEEKLILRERGSGTRAIFENFLREKSFSVQSFKWHANINSYKLIEKIVKDTKAISFVYSIMSRKSENIATFKIKNHRIFHEFNFVFLKNTKADDIIKMLLDEHRIFI